MKTKSLVSFVAFLLLFGLVLFAAIEKLSLKRSISNRLKNVPPLLLTLTDGGPFVLPERTRLLLIIFDPACDHCQRQAHDVRLNLGRLPQCSVVWISTAPLQDIATFSVEYQLDKISNVHFAGIKTDEMSTAFGSHFIPHLFIYGEDRRLIKEFKGETKMESILGYMNSDRP